MTLTEIPNVPTGAKTMANIPALGDLRLFGAKCIIRQMRHPRISSQRMVPETIRLRLDLLAVSPQLDIAVGI